MIFSYQKDMKMKIKTSKRKDELALQWARFCMELINYKKKQNPNPQTNEKPKK
jgi:hypothetical protein